MSDNEHNSEMLENENTNEQESTEQHSAEDLQKQLEEERENNRRAQERIHNLNKENEKRRLREKEIREKEEKLGSIDPDEYEQLKREREDRERRKLEEKGEFEKLRERMLENHQRELEDLRSEIKQRDQLVERTLIDKELTSAISKYKGDTEFLPQIIRERLRLEKTEDGFEVYATDPDGTRAISDDGAGYLGVEGFVKSLRNDPKFGKFFEFDGPSGNGSDARPTGGKQPVATDLRKSSMNEQQIRDFVKKHSWEDFHKLPD